MLAVELEGSPFECGYQHGKQFSAQIREALHTFCPEWWGDSPQIQEISNRLLSSLASAAPEMVIEMTGISAGAQVSFERILLLNLVLATNDLGSDPTQGPFQLACTAIGLTDSDAGPLELRREEGGCSLLSIPDCPS